MIDPQHKDEFESFLHKQVKDHRMYPSDQLWRNIQIELHGEGTWPALTFIAIFIITALSVCTMMVKPEERLHRNTIVYPAQKETIVSEKTKAEEREAAATTPVQYAYTDRITQQTMQLVSDIIIARTYKQNSQSPLSITKESLLAVQDKTMRGTNVASELTLSKSTIAKKPEISPAIASVNTVAEDKSTVVPLQFEATMPASRYFSTLGLMNLSNSKMLSSDNNDEMWRNYPLLSAKDSWKKTLSKFSFQFYLTPSISYRRLNDAHGKTAQSYTALPSSTSYQLDVNRVAEHSAEMGAEVGFALGYKLSNTLTAKGGFQFNVRQYGIKAYTVSVPTQSAGTDNLTGTVPNSDESNATNPYLTSSANTSDGSQPVMLNNRYYELSVPLGLDWRIMVSNNGRLSVNAAASLQPTYTFDKAPFVITTDYKNYTDGASIMNNWNLNSNVEAYITYKMGSFQWQLGPQFRYQHFSTYSNFYPIREHLLDYGIKIGFTKSLD